MTAMLEIDHLAIAGETLEEARAHVEEALGVPMQAGGTHDVFHTHNALLGLEDGLYLEAIAVNPDAPLPHRPRWFDLDRFTGPPRLTNWICRTGDLGGSLDDIPLDLGAPVDLARGDLRWRMAVPEDGILPFDNCAPAVMACSSGVHPARRLAPRIVRLRSLTIRHPQSGLLADLLNPHLSDRRVIFEPGAPGPLAECETLHGRREIGG